MLFVSSGFIEALNCMVCKSFLRFLLPGYQPQTEQPMNADKIHFVQRYRHHFLKARAFRNMVDEFVRFLLFKVCSVITEKMLINRHVRLPCLRLSIILGDEYSISSAGTPELNQADWSQQHHIYTVPTRILSIHGKLCGRHARCYGSSDNIDVTLPECIALNPSTPKGGCASPIRQRLSGKESAVRVWLNIANSGWSENSMCTGCVEYGTNNKD